MLKKFFSKKEDNPEKGQGSYEHANQKGKIVIKSKKKNPNPSAPIKSGPQSSGQNPMYAEDIIKSFENQASQRRQVDQGVASDISAAQQKEIQELQEDLDALRQASDELRTELASAHQENTELKKHLKEKEGLLEQLNQKIEEDSSNIDDQDAKGHQAALEELKSQFDSTEAENTDLKTQLEILKTDLDTAQMNAAKLEDEIKKSSTLKTSAANELEKELKASIQKLEKKNAEIEKLRLEIDQEAASSKVLQSQIIEAEKNSAKSAKEIKKREEKYKVLEEKFQAYKESSIETGGMQRELEKELERHQKVIEEWEKKSTQWSVELEKAERALKHSAEELTALKTSKKALNEEIKSFQKKEKSLLEEQDELKVGLSVLEEEKKEFETKVQQLEKDKSAIENEKADLLASMQNIESGNADQQSALDLSSKELMKISKEKEALEVKFKEGSDQLSENSKKIKQLERSLEKSAKLHADLQSQLTTTEKGEKALESELKKLGEQLKKSEALKLESEKKSEHLVQSRKKLEEEYLSGQAKKEKAHKDLAANWKKEKSELQKQIEMLSGDADAKYEQLENDLIEWKHKGESDAKAIQKLSKTKSELEAELKAFDAKITELENSHKKIGSDWDDEKSSLEKEIATLGEKEKQFKDHLRTMEKEKTLALSELDQANKNTEALQSEIEKAQKLLEASQGNNDELKALEKAINKITTERDGLAVAISDFEDRVTKYDSDAKLSLEKIELLNNEIASLTEQVASAESIPEPDSPAEVKPEPEESQAQIEGEYNIVVRIMPDADEFEVELPAAFTGAEIISELMEAGVLSEETAYELFIERTGDYIGGDETLFDSPVEENELVIIR